MRENRPYGSEGGESGSTGPPYPYLWTRELSGRRLRVRSPYEPQLAGRMAIAIRILW